MIVVLDALSDFVLLFFFFQAEDGIRDTSVTGVQTCALPIYSWDRRADFSAAHTARKSVATTASTPLPHPPPQGGRGPTERGERLEPPPGFSLSWPPPPLREKGLEIGKGHVRTPVTYLVPMPA